MTPAPGGRAPLGPASRSRPSRSVTSMPPMASTTSVVFEALGITSNRSSSTHHTMMSSTTNPSVVEEVGVLGPARMDPRQIVAQRVLQVLEGVGAADAHRAEVAHVEGDGRGAAGPVLGHRPRWVRQGHLPAAERNHLGAELEVRRMTAVRPADGAALRCRRRSPGQTRPLRRAVRVTRSARRSRAGTRWRSAPRGRARACAAPCGSCV